MPEKIAHHIHTFSRHVKDGGAEYEARVYGIQRRDGTWEGWLEFHNVNGDRDILRTGQETSQPTRNTLAYWAGGLEPVYLEGALARALEQKNQKM